MRVDQSLDTLLQISVISEAYGTLVDVYNQWLGRRYLRSPRGAMRPDYTPKLKKRTALLRELKQVFRRYRSQPVERVISLINPVLRGWVNYFALGHSSECFSYIKDWVEKKVRRHLTQARKRGGFGWEQWSRPWLYDTLRLFNSYRVRRYGLKAAPAC